MLVKNIFDYLNIPLQPTLFYQSEAIEEDEIKRVQKNVGIIKKIFKITLDKWQEAVLIASCVKKDNKYIFPTIVLSIPRQQGKTFYFFLRILYGLIFEKEKILATGQTQNWATKNYNEIYSLLTQDKNTKSFIAYAGSNTRLSKDEIVIKLKTSRNSVCIFKTRGYTGNAIRGGSTDLLIYDECQLLNAEHIEAISPTTIASKNPQKVYAGTPPPISAYAKGTGELFYRQRKQVLKKEFKGLYIEYGIQHINNLKKSTTWHEYLPAVYEKRIHIDNIKGEQANMEPLGFMREYLGWWGELSMKGKNEISIKQWKSLECERPNEKPKNIYGGLSFGINRTDFCLTLCYTYESRPTFLEVVYKASYEELFNGSQTPEEILAEKIDKLKINQLAVDMKQNALGLVEKLKTKAIFPAYDKKKSFGEFYLANQQFLDAIKYNKIKHAKDNAIDKYIPTVVKKISNKNNIIDVKWFLTSEENNEIIKSLVLALWCSTQKIKKKGIRVII